MRIRLLAFATARRALGADERDFELAAGSTVGDLAAALAAARPEIAAELPRWAIAVEGRLARPEEPLAEGAEVALLPPVSGG
jgi:molybdopterin converting factor subunit 1